MKDLKDLREEIGAVDEEMAKLFVRRMQAVRGVADYKKEHGLAIMDSVQEQRVIESRSSLVGDDELRPYYIQFLQDVMDVSKRWQHRLMHGQKVAYCPARDQNAAEAAATAFPDADHIECGSYAEAYEKVENSECDVAVLPFEVSYYGEVGHVLDLLFEGSLHVNDICEITDGDETTRYLVVSRADSKLQDPGTAFLIMFTVKDETGGLAKAINVISAYGFNMRIMRSRPMKDLPWHYYFYAEVLGNDLSENGSRMVNALRVACPSVKVVGRYSI